MENIITTIMGLADQLPAWVAAITALVTGASAITALTPTRWDNKILDGISVVLNFISLNVLKNKNADDE